MSANRFGRVFWPHWTRSHILFLCCKKSASQRAQRNEETYEGDDGLEAQVVNRRAQLHQEMVHTPDFDPTFDPNEYITPSSSENCIDGKLFQAKSPSVLYEKVKLNILGLSAKGKYECSICMCEVEDNDKVRVLDCKHAFHVRCIDPWVLQSHSICPLCRMNLLD